MTTSMQTSARQQLAPAVAASEIRYWRSLPARQQAEWADREFAERMRDDLTQMPALVEWEEALALRAQLAEVAEGRAQVIQMGDCAENPEECTPEFVEQKARMLDLLAVEMQIASGKPAIRVGRMAGQFAKPRSKPVENVGGTELPVYRGHMVNGPEPTPEARAADASRLILCYRAASSAMSVLRLRNAVAPQGLIWTSHEALVLDYELPLLRREADGSRLLSSTHWPWIGARTNQPEGAHVQFLSTVSNPVACKVGPETSTEQVLALCRLLDPAKAPGRLTLIARMGADKVTDHLPRLVRAVRDAGHPVIWMCDPMHGNTVTAPDGRKTRIVESVIGEVAAFRMVLADEGIVAGGLHLEATPLPVTECVLDSGAFAQLNGAYTTLCDPRLNAAQTLEVVAAWNGVN